MILAPPHEVQHIKLITDKSVKKITVMGALLIAVIFLPPQYRAYFFSLYLARIN